MVQINCEYRQKREVGMGKFFICLKYAIIKFFAARTSRCPTLQTDRRSYNTTMTLPSAIL